MKRASLDVASYELQVIVLCQQGYQSSLAAASLQDLGVRRATDVVGGFEEWMGRRLTDETGNVGRAGRNSDPLSDILRGRAEFVSVDDRVRVWGAGEIDDVARAVVRPTG